MEQKNNSVPSAETKDDSSNVADVTTSSPNNAKPYVRRCICPKCRKSDLTLTEIWKGHSTEFHYYNGKITNNKANEIGNPFMVRSFCNNCFHEWNLKGITQITDLGSGYIA